MREEASLANAATGKYRRMGQSAGQVQPVEAGGQMAVFALAAVVDRAAAGNDFAFVR